jgi:hypothetical protein
MSKKEEFKLDNRYNTYAIKEHMDEALMGVWRICERSRSWKGRGYTRT